MHVARYVRRAAVARYTLAVTCWSLRASRSALAGKRWPLLSGQYTPAVTYLASYAVMIDAVSVPIMQKSIVLGRAVKSAGFHDQ